MLLKSLLTLAGAASTAFSVAVPAHGNSPLHVLRRRMNESSVCTSFGLNYQDGGVYFINTSSNQSFTIVSAFEGCNNDTADVSLVNTNTGDQYECGQVPTVPDNAPQTATCPVLKSQLTSGTYLIILIGNNGNGNPFAEQRKITIIAGPQQTITQHPTVTITTTPTIIANSTHFFNHTTTVSNNLTITESPVTRVTTTTLRNMTTTQNKTITETLNRSTTIDSISTVTVTPTCRIPDPVCSLLFPTGNFTLPASLNLHRRMQDCADAGKPSILKRDLDQSVTTVFASGNATTITVTAAPTARPSSIPITITIPVTAPPHTVSGGEVVRTVTAPGFNNTDHGGVYTTIYANSTIRSTSTQTVTTTPPALSAECANKGGSLEV